MSTLPASAGRIALLTIGLLALWVCSTSSESIQDSVPRVAAQESLQGKFLVAEPRVDDPRFMKAIILIIDHTADGAMGLVVNKVMGSISSSQMLTDLGLEPENSDRGPADRELKMFFGGPVELNRGFILHSLDVMPDSSRKVAEEIAFSADATTIRLLLSEKGPTFFLIAFGYSGWAPGQLDAELERGDWRVLPVDAEVIFSENPEKSWDLLMRDQVFHL